MGTRNKWFSEIDAFFDDLEIYEDIHNGTDYKRKICCAIDTFLDSATEDDAEKVYSTFFEAYWIGDNENNPFLDLINKVKKYEQIAGSLIKKQRDHYAHAVYVFIFGLAVYQEVPSFRRVFYQEFLPRTNYKDIYPTNHEEFFYRWGLCALFHDIAYPLEITINQLNEYFNHSLSYGHEQWEERFLDITGFSDYKKCHCFEVKEEYQQEFSEKYGASLSLDKTDSCALVAKDISKDLELNYDETYESLYTYDKRVSEGKVDHAYFGALICLRWHSSLILTQNWNPAYFFFPVLDAASSIFLHNGYKIPIPERGLSP